MIKIDILVRTNRHSVSISVNPECKVIIKAPRSLPLQEIQRIVDKKENWIILHKQKISKSMQLNQSVLTYKDILFLGNIYHVVYDNKIKSIKLARDYLMVPEKYSDKIIRKLVLWYKKLALNILLERVNYFGNLMQLSPDNVKLTNAKTCWGTCNSKRVVSLNWRLVLLPHELIDYVVVHELAHLVQLNHSKLFWDVVRSVLPDVAIRRGNLKQGDYLLSLFRT